MASQSKCQALGGGVICQTQSQRLSTRTSAHVPSPYLPCFLFTPALFCFANRFFIYFSCCCKLQEEQTGERCENQAELAGHRAPLTLQAQGWLLAPLPTCACCVVACVESCSSSSGTDSSLSDSVPDPAEMNTSQFSARHLARSCR